MAQLISALREPSAPKSEKKRLRARLLEERFDMVVDAARVLRGKGIPYSDLLQEGALALMATFERPDISAVVDFEEYAEAAIEDRLRSLVEGAGGSTEKSSGLLEHAVAPDAHADGFEARRIEAAHTLLGMLGPDQEQVLKLRFGFDTTQSPKIAEVARSLGINRSRVSALESRALLTLRRAVHRLRWTFPR